MSYKREIWFLLGMIAYFILVYLLYSLPVALALCTFTMLTISSFQITQTIIRLWRGRQRQMPLMQFVKENVGPNARLAIPMFIGSLVLAEYYLDPLPPVFIIVFGALAGLPIGGKQGEQPKDA